MALNAVYLTFAVFGLAIFRMLPVRTAILAVFLGGWLLLPVGHYPPPRAEGLPWWIPGLALPSNMLVTKAWIAPLVALIGAMFSNRDRLRDWRPAPIDLAMLAWCLWPLIDGIVARTPKPDPFIATFYVTGSWGIPWLLGRIWFADRRGRYELVRGMAFGTLACLPFAILDGVAPAWIYRAVYGEQPFWFDGAPRYIGYRPMGLFEHGNQYGIWTAMGALAALWMAVGAETERRRFIGVAAATLAIALASQSIGAIGLLIIGVALLTLWGRPVVVPALVGGGAIIVIVGLLHVSGIVPIRRIVDTTSIGQHALGVLRAAGRDSFAWRIAQDLKILDAVRAHLILGTADWDWWRIFRARPWGLAMLLLGQYGLIGLVAAFGSLSAAAFRGLRSHRGIGAFAGEAVAIPLGLIVLLTLADGLLNSFFYFPAIIAAGSVAVRVRHPRTQRSSMLSSGLSRTGTDRPSKLS